MEGMVQEILRRLGEPQRNTEEEFEEEELDEVATSSWPTLKTQEATALDTPVQYQGRPLGLASRN